MINRGCPGQNKIYFLPYNLYFLVNRGGARTSAGIYLGSAPDSTRTEKFVYPVWVRTRLDLIFLESQTDSNSTRTIWNPRWPEMIWDQTTRILTRSKPKQLETRDDPRSDNLKPNPIRNWTTQKPRQLRIRRPNTRPNPNPNEPKLEMTQDQTIWNQPDLILKDLNMIKL
jgi:hypothetical protein